MEKRYQVFISSTFQDLKNARQEVSQALLRADCFPAGMELFPAADEEQFAFIKTIIDQSDYYIIISAGRYGSIHPETGLSYTEMEYDYAVEIGKPVIRLLHKDPRSLASEGDESLAKLMLFRTKMTESKMVAFWETPDELGRETAFSLWQATKTKSAAGWVKGDHALSEEIQLELSELRAAKLSAELEIATTEHRSSLSQTKEAIEELSRTNNCLTLHQIFETHANKFVIGRSSIFLHHENLWECARDLGLDVRSYKGLLGAMINDGLFTVSKSGSLMKTDAYEAINFEIARLELLGN